MNKSPIYKWIWPQVKHQFPVELGFYHQIKVGWNPQQQFFDVYIHLRAPSNLGRDISEGRNVVNRWIKQAWPNATTQYRVWPGWQLNLRIPFLEVTQVCGPNALAGTLVPFFRNADKKQWSGVIRPYNSRRPKSYAVRSTGTGHRTDNSKSVLQTMGNKARNFWEFLSEYLPGK